MGLHIGENVMVPSMKFERIFSRRQAMQPLQNDNLRVQGPPKRFLKAPDLSRSRPYWHGRRAYMVPIEMIFI